MIFITISNIPFRFADHEDLIIPIGCTIIDGSGEECDIVEEEQLSNDKVYYTV
jgi:hypothetical protein